MDKNLTTKFVITVFICTWFIWGFAVLSSQDVMNFILPNSLLIVLGTFMPSTVGVFYIIKSSNKGLKEVLKNTFLLRGETTYIALIFLLMPALFALAYIITTVFFSATYDLPWLARPFELPILFIYILLLGGPLGEEIGWRGFLLPRMLTSNSPFRASLLLGFIWSIWHLPLFLIEGTVQSSISLILYIVYTVVLTFLMTFLYLKTNKRTSSALYMHASANTALGVFYIIDQPIGIIFVGLFMLGALAFILIKNRNDFFFDQS